MVICILTRACKGQPDPRASLLAIVGGRGLIAPVTPPLPPARCPRRRRLTRRSSVVVPRPSSNVRDTSLSSSTSVVNRRSSGVFRRPPKSSTVRLSPRVVQPPLSVVVRRRRHHRRRRRLRCCRRRFPAFWFPGWSSSLQAGPSSKFWSERAFGKVPGPIRIYFNPGAAATRRLTPPPPPSSSPPHSSSLSFLAILVSGRPLVVLLISVFQKRNLEESFFLSSWRIFPERKR